jgi:glycosyltransferase involved in cell wall biosynthesis
MGSIRKVKVIHILPYTISDPIYYEGGWHSRVVRQILKTTSNYDIECWGYNKTAKKTISFEDREVKYRIFPSAYIKYLGEISIPLMKELRSLSKNEHIIIHHHSVFGLGFNLISLIFRDIPIIAQHHGGKSSLQRYDENKNSNIPKAFAYLILYTLRLEFLFERVALKNVDRFFVLNEMAKAYLSNICGDDKMEVLTMGVDFNLFRKLDRAKCRKLLGLNLESNYILYVGAFFEGKGLGYLIKAFSEVLVTHPNSILLLVGSGYYKKYVENESKALGIENKVVFRPWTKNEIMPLYYNGSDICVLPSLGEGLPIVGVEASACCTPFVGTSVGGIPDIIKNFRAGRLIPPKNSRELSSAIIEILSNSDKNVMPDIENAKIYYDWRNIVKRTLEVYEELEKQYYF